MLSIKKIGTLGKRYRNLIRYQQIIGIILRYGFDNILDALDFDRYIESGLKLIPFYKPHERVEKLSRNQRIRMALEELGPTFIKMGQVLSSRPDLIPLDLIAELTRLQDEIPAFGFDQVKETITAEFGKPLEEVFQFMDEQPFACASIGQVHRASVTGGDVWLSKSSVQAFERLLKRIWKSSIIWPASWKEILKRWHFTGR